MLTVEEQTDVSAREPFGLGRIGCEHRGERGKLLLDAGAPNWSLRDVTPH